MLASPLIIARTHIPTRIAFNGPPSTHTLYQIQVVTRNTIYQQYLTKTKTNNAIFVNIPPVIF